MSKEEKRDSMMESKTSNELEVENRWRTAGYCSTRDFSRLLIYVLDVHIPVPISGEAKHETLPKISK